jgi:DNA-directed RNA polymerase delta subunit
MVCGYFEYSDYSKLIHKAIDWDNSLDIGYFFLAVYEDHKAKNPRFIYYTGKAIWELRDFIKVDPNEYKNIPIFKSSGKQLGSKKMAQLFSAYEVFTNQVYKNDGIGKAQYFEINAYTHRQYALAENYKIESGEAERKTPKQIEEIYGAKRKQAYYSLNPKSRTAYRPVNIKELEKAIELLLDFPKALHLATVHIEQLKKQ